VLVGGVVQLNVGRGDGAADSESDMDVSIDRNVLREDSVNAEENDVPMDDNWVEELHGDD
jgi:hypothetical protein